MIRARPRGTGEPVVYDGAVKEKRARDPLEGLQERLGYFFSDRELLARALRHGSAASAVGGGSYQRLEFLGDAVIGHAVSLLLFTKFPAKDEGELTRMKSQLIRSATLARKGAALGLEEAIELGAGEEKIGGRHRAALLEDVFEALVGAMALDAGWERVREFVESQFIGELDGLDERSLLIADPKTALQEAAQARRLPLPEYRQVSAAGPDHHPRWVFEVIWDGEKLARGEGGSKREAQRDAALRGLQRLGLV